MAFEYRIQLDVNVNRLVALELLGSSPYFQKPSSPFQEGEVWLSLDPKRDFPDVRLFPETYGFFVEIASLPNEIKRILNDWITQLCTLGNCCIIDNDTDEIVDIP